MLFTEKPDKGLIFTDIAEERIPDDDPLRTQTVRESTDVCDIVRLKVADRMSSERLGLPIGCFTTLHFPKDALFTESAATLAQLIADELLHLLPDGRYPRSILAVGLGNRHITPDALGPLTVDRIPITRQLPDMPLKISGLSPGVIGQTGIDCGELIGGWVESDHPDLIVAIDALAAKSTDRLAATVQISDCGIVPGSGVGNHRGEISERLLGVPVLTLGVPTVVDSRTLVLDALESSAIEADDRLLEILRDRQFFATLPDCDRRVEALADLLADGLTGFLECCTSRGKLQPS